MSASMEFKEKCKHISPQSLEGYGLLSTARKNGYLCPHCSNGSGDDGTGIEFELLNDGYKAYCHKCEKYFDVFDLIAIKNRFNVKTQFPDIIAEAKRIFGDIPKSSTQPVKKKSTEKKPDEFKSFIKSAFKHLPDFFVSQKDWRGLTLDTLKNFGCGYVPKWYDGTVRMIIPDCYSHFLARFIGSNPPPDAKIKQHRGTKEIFGLKIVLDALQENANLLIFAVEGEIDAMSIHQVGFHAIAFGGSDISAHQQTCLKKIPPKSKIILMLDADETGKSKTPKLHKILESIGFSVYDSFLDEKFADSNAALQVNPAELKNALQKIYSDAETFFAENPPAENQNPLPEGVKRTDIEGVNEITPDYKPTAPISSDGGIEKVPQQTMIQIGNCPLDLSVPINFDFSAYNIREIIENEKTGKEKTVMITHTPIIPTRILQKKDCTETQIELAVYDRLKNAWEKHIVPMSTIANAREIVKLADLGVSINSSRARGLSNFLTDILRIGENAKVIPKILIYEKTGWTDDKCETFIYPPGDDGYVVQNGGFDYEKKFRSKGDKNKWAAYFQAAYVGSVAARYTFGLVCAAPLVRLCKSRNFQGVLVAPSGSGKSAIVKFAMSIFGDPNELKNTFNSTQNFTDELSSKFNDLPCWVDEFQSADENTRKNFSNVIFNYAEENSRGRMSRDAKMRETFKFKGTRICTSEQTVLQSNFTQGAFNRVFEIELGKIYRPVFAKDLHNVSAENFGLFFKDYIEFIRTRKDYVLKIFDNYQRKLASYNFIPQHAEHIALAYTGLTCFFEVMRAQGLDAFECPPNLDPEHLLDTEDIQFFRELLPSPQESNNIVRARAFLAEILVSHAQQFYRERSAKVEGVTAIDPDPPTLKPTIGYKYFNGDVAFLPDQLNKILAENKFPPARSLMRGLSDAGLLEIGGGSVGKQFKKSTRIAGNPLSVYVVKAAAFEVDTVFS